MSSFSTSRRNFIKGAAAGSIALSTREGTSAQAQPAQEQSVINMPFENAEPRIGIIGTGGRGTSLLKNLLGTDVQVKAVCDIVQEKAQAAAAHVEQAAQKAPELYTNGEHAYEELLKRDDLNFVVIATPWRWHTTMAVAAMREGKHVASELPAATTIDECWDLVNTSEKTRRHCVMLENCCYGENETLVLNMVRAGLFGDLLYGAGAYLHDLRRILFEEHTYEEASEDLWRRFPHTKRNGNLYPTHGLGPVANYMGINRGDRFDYLVSMSSPERGLDAWREAHLPKDSPIWKEKYICGDMNTSLIKTANGLTVTLEHDVVNPQPYSRLNTIAGTKGVFRDYPRRIYFEGQA